MTEAIPQAWDDLKAAAQQVGELLHRAPTLSGEVRQEQLLRLLSLIELAILSLPDSGPEHWDDVEISRADYREVVCDAFPEFGFYNFVRRDALGDDDSLPDVNDAIDDLDEILSDLDHAFKHEAAIGRTRAVWEVRESHSTHFGSHLVDLRAYVYRLRFPAL